MNFDLLKKYLEGNTSQSERDEVFRWIKLSPDNETELNQLRKLQDIFLWHLPGKKNTLSDRRRKIGPAILWGVIAIFLVGVCLSIFFYHSYFLRQEGEVVLSDNLKGMEQVVVPWGQSVKLLLADGTNVWLNSNSKLVFTSSFEENQRVVQLQGEGFFEVAHDPQHPFIVEVGQYRVKVLGTEFNVKAYHSDTHFEASLLSGSVEINRKETSENLLLKPQERVIITDNEVKLTTIGVNDFLWREGILFLDNKSIYEIALLLEQYYDTKIHIAEGRQITRKYTGKFRLQDGAVHILKVLELQNDFIVKNDTINNLITIE